MTNPWTLREIAIKHKRSVLQPRTVHLSKAAKLSILINKRKMLIATHSKTIRWTKRVDPLQSIRLLQISLLFSPKEVLIRIMNRVIKRLWLFYLTHSNNLTPSRTTLWLSRNSLRQSLRLTRKLLKLSRN